MNIRCVAWTIVALLAAGPASAAVEYGETALSIPMTDAQGQSHRLAGRLCVPTRAQGKTRLVIINHGSPANADDRPTMTLGSCNSEVAQWFLARGYAVLYALRRGYGATGGAWAEAYGPCGHPDYAAAGLESARDIAAMVDYATKLPAIKPYGVVVAGVSAGGWATIAYDSTPHPKVVAMISMAGGRGGHRNGEPNSNCHPEMLAAAAGAYGHGASTPMLWVYAQNDTFFRPEIASALYAAYTSAGGKTDFHAVGPNGDEGHYLWSARGGSAVWGPLVETYLKQRGAWEHEPAGDSAQ